MRLPLDAQQPVTKPVAPKAITFNASTKFIILKHRDGCGEDLCAFSPTHWDIEKWPFLQ